MTASLTDPSLKLDDYPTSVHLVRLTPDMTRDQLDDALLDWLHEYQIRAERFEKDEADENTEALVYFQQAFSAMIWKLIH